MKTDNSNDTRGRHIGDDVVEGESLAPCNDIPPEKLPVLVHTRTVGIENKYSRNISDRDIAHSQFNSAP